MSYLVREVYYTLQGEGAHTGRPAIFCRFAGCDLWSGREEDRSSAVCTFCDTDIVGTDGPGGGKFRSAPDLATAIHARWLVDAAAQPFVVCTGGEPLLQLDGKLVAAFHAAGLEVAVETNGTREAPAGIDWVTVSPKAGARLVLMRGNELKLVYPQAQAPPELYESLDLKRFYVQPMDGPVRARNTRRAIDYCLAHPGWRLSAQTHKDIGLP